MMNRTASAILVVALSVWSLHLHAAQAPTLAFDVASVKPSPDPRTVDGIVRPSPGLMQPGGRWVASFVSLEAIIRSAYPGHGFPGQIVGGPSWVRSDRWEIVAKTDPSRSNDEVSAMARALLADRFKLSVHTEKRELSVYRVVHARDDRTLGPGLRRPEIDCDAYRAAQRKGEPPPLGRPAERLPCVATIVPGSPGARLTAGGTTINGITSLLASQVGRPVIDATGLSQPFDIDVVFSTGTLTATPAATPDDRSSIFEAMQQQLGLKLESGRGDVDVLVLDRVERPTPD